MKQLFKIFAILAIFIVSTYAFNYNSVWINENSNSRGVTKLIIKNSGTIKAFGSCSPNDCDWGFVGYTRTINGLLSSWKQRGLGHKVILLESIRGNRIKATIKYLYNDRRDKTKIEYFKKRVHKVDKFRDFMGTWINEDRHSRGLTRLNITKRGHNINIRAWSSCQSGNCDWGRFLAVATHNKLRVDWHKNGLRGEMILSGVDIDRDGKFQTLKIKFISFYNNGRTKKSRVYYFYKQ